MRRQSTRESCQPTSRLAEIDEFEASIAKLTENIIDFTKAVELDAVVSKAIALRQAEKAKNTETIRPSLC